MSRKAKEKNASCDILKMSEEYELFSEPYIELQFLMSRFKEHLNLPDFTNIEFEEELRKEQYNYNADNSELYHSLLFDQILECLLTKFMRSSSYLKAKDLSIAMVEFAQKNFSSNPFEGHSSYDFHRLPSEVKIWVLLHTMLYHCYKDEAQEVDTWKTSNELRSCQFGQRSDKETLYYFHDLRLFKKIGASNMKSAPITIDEAYLQSAPWRDAYLEVLRGTHYFCVANSNTSWQELILKLTKSKSASDKKIAGELSSLLGKIKNQFEIIVKTYNTQKNARIKEALKKDQEFRKNMGLCRSSQRIQAKRVKEEEDAKSKPREIIDTCPKSERLSRADRFNRRQELRQYSPDIDTTNFILKSGPIIPSMLSTTSYPTVVETSETDVLKSVHVSETKKKKHGKCGSKTIDGVKLDKSKETSMLDNYRDSYKTFKLHQKIAIQEFGVVPLLPVRRKPRSFYIKKRAPEIVGNPSTSEIYNDQLANSNATSVLFTDSNNTEMVDDISFESSVDGGIYGNSIVSLTTNEPQNDMEFSLCSPNIVSLDINNSPDSCWKNSSPPPLVRQCFINQDSISSGVSRNNSYDRFSTYAQNNHNGNLIAHATTSLQSSNGNVHIMRNKRNADSLCDEGLGKLQNFEQAYTPINVGHEMEESFQYSSQNSTSSRSPGPRNSYLIRIKDDDEVNELLLSEDHPPFKLESVLNAIKGKIMNFYDDWKIHFNIESDLEEVEETTDMIDNYLHRNRDAGFEIVRESIFQLPISLANKTSATITKFQMYCLAKSLLKFNIYAWPRLLRTLSEADRKFIETSERCLLNMNFHIENHIWKLEEEGIQLTIKDTPYYGEWQYGIILSVELE